MTIEGLDATGELDALKASFLRHGSAQCGICTPGMLVAAAALLRRAPSPSPTQVQDALGGVLCRCTGYRKIIDAVLDAPMLDGRLHFPRREAHRAAVDAWTASVPLSQGTRAGAAASACGGERECIVSTLAGVRGNVARAARQLGMPRSTLRYRIRLYGL